MIVKDGTYEPFGDPIDPQDPARLMAMITSIPVGEPEFEPLAIANGDPNAPADANLPILPLTPLGRPLTQTEAPPRKRKIEIIRGTKTSEQEVEGEKDETVEGDGR